MQGVDNHMSLCMMISGPFVCVRSGNCCTSHTWAARYNTWLRIIFMPKGAVLLSSFLPHHMLLACPPGNKVGTLFNKEAAQQVKQEWLQAQKEQSADSNKPGKVENTAPRDMAVRARTASRALQNLSSKQRAQLLHKIAENLLFKEEEIMQENDKDCQVGCVGQQ